MKQPHEAQAAAMGLPIIGALWEYIGKDPMGHRIEPCCRALHEMNPDQPPYPDTWRVVDKVVKLGDATASIAAQQEEIVRLRALLTRYRNETPLGNQPHMIAHEVDTILNPNQGAKT